MTNALHDVPDLPRIPALELFPVVEGGRLPAKAAVGDPFPIRATVFKEGHDAFAAEVVLLDPDGVEHDRVLMVDCAPGLDRVEAWVMCDRPGTWSFRVDSWADPYATWVHEAKAKISANIDIDLVMDEATALFRRAGAGQAHHNPDQVEPPAEVATLFEQTAEQMQDRSHSAFARLHLATSPQVRDAFARYPLRDLLGHTETYPLYVARNRAVTGAWYELFPRSIGAYQNPDGSWVSGTLKTTADALPRVHDMGFDVVYLTPVHPIGTQFRKGKNNALHAGPVDPGSPYAIGSTLGGHDSINPELGTFADFDALVQRAHDLGMEVALDFALQCAPDHPWVKEHPEWFTTRVDGTIAYAENPPKKYQDIYPLNFDNDPEGIFNAVYELLELWAGHGVTIFRVDNPHTKPVDFWQRLMRKAHREHPELIFLAEAFTRPAMMRSLGMAGFDQSYTYFAWRTKKKELEEYLEEVSATTAHLMRPTFFPITPDILTEQMTTGGIAIFEIRAMLAALACPNFGIYSGFEWAENVQRPGAEEPNDNEKYEYRPRNWDEAERTGIPGLLRVLNRARAKHPALRQLHQLTIQKVDHPDIIAFSKHVPAKFSPTGADDTVLAIISLDPHHPVQGMVHLDLEAMGLAGAETVELTDEVDGHTYWWGKDGYVELSPTTRLGHIFSVKAAKPQAGTTHAEHE